MHAAPSHNAAICGICRTVGRNMRRMSFVRTFRYTSVMQALQPNRFFGQYVPPEDDVHPIFRV